MATLEKDIKATPSAYRTKIIFLLITLIIFLFLGYLFILNTWKVAISKTENDAVMFAQAVEAGINSNVQAAINLDASSSRYLEIKDILSHIVRQAEDIRFAYIYVQKEGEIYILADSEPIGSADYSPSGQLYKEAEQAFYTPFEEGKTMITGPVSDRWGKWISVLVPIKDSDTNKVISVLGMDYPVLTWYEEAVNRTILASFFVICAIIILIVLLLSLGRNKELRHEKKKLQKISEKLKESESLFSTVFDQANIGIAVVHDYQFTSSENMNLPRMNPMFEKIMGRSQEELSSISWPDITHPDDLALDLKNFENFKNGLTNGYDMEKRFVRPDGSSVWVHMMISPLKLRGFPENCHLCLIEDIGKRKELERTLYDSERSKAVFLDNLPGMMYRCYFDKDWTMQYVSHGFYALTGYKPESILYNRDLSFNELILPKYRDKLWDKWQAAIKEKGTMEEEYEIVTASGEVKWVWEQGQGVYDDEGNAKMLEGLILDITQRKHNEIRLKYLSERDPLTDMCNLRLFEEIFSYKNRINKKSAVVMVNVRRFGIVNSTFGYRFGIKLIQDIGKCLQTLAGEDCPLFHISIDRFVFYVTEYSSKQDLYELCDNVIKVLNTCITQKTINFNIGVIENDSYPYSDVDNVLKNVSVASDHVSTNERFGYCFFNKEMEDTVQREIAIRHALTAAVYEGNDDCLFMEYQPIYNFKTNSISGFEALARFKNDDLGIISPAEFIPIAESSQLILPLGEKIMRHVFVFAQRLSSAGYGAASVSFNISAIQLLNDVFLDDLENLIQTTKADPRNLILEITESVFSDNYKEINEKINKIRKLGMKISIDDFGTGYSSLARERELNINFLKIDKYFIDSLLSENTSKSVTCDIISMAHKLGHDVIAEGVEHEIQKEYLCRNHCDMIQGYLISKPLDEDGAIKILQKND